jgi:hypothetical protein
VRDRQVSGQLPISSIVARSTLNATAVGLARNVEAAAGYTSKLLANAPGHGTSSAISACQLDRKSSTSIGPPIPFKAGARAAENSATASSDGRSVRPDRAKDLATPAGFDGCWNIQVRGLVRRRAA